MESWSQASASEKAKQPAKISTSSSSPPNRPVQQKGVQLRGQPKKQTDYKPQAMEKKQYNRIVRNAKHRRSMSDPNLHKNFQAMKQLWDKKAEQDSKTSPTLRQLKSRGNSLSASDCTDIASQSSKNSHGSSKPVSIQPEAKNKPARSAISHRMENLREEKPSNERRQKSYSIADADCGGLVKNRAKLFDVNSDKKSTQNSPKSSANRNKNRSSSGESIHSSDDTSDRGRVNVQKLAIRNARSQDKSTSAGNNNKKIQVEERKSDLALLLDNEESVHNEQEDGEDAIVDRMRKNSAHLARERRRNSRRGSNQSDTDSNCSASSLSSASLGENPLIRRTYSKEDNVEAQSSKSPVIKSYLHRNASPKTEASVSPESNSPKPDPRGNATERRDSLGSIVSTGSISLPTAPRRKSSLHKERSSSPSPSPSAEIAISPTEALHRKLSYDAAKRASMSADSGTGTASPANNRNSRSSTKSIGNRESVASAPESFRRGGSFSSLSSTGRTPPVPPPSCDKPTRARSASSSPMPIKPNCPPPAPPGTKTTPLQTPSGSSSLENGSNASTPTISSRLSILSATGDSAFNAEEEFNKILGAIATPTDAKRFRTYSGLSNGEEAPQNSLLDVEDSDKQTKRDSLEVPPRNKPRASDNDSLSDFDISDADEEGNQMPLTPSSPAEPTPTKEPLEVKLHNIAKELLSTEITYVDVLKLIDQIFHKRVLEAISKKQISSDVKNIFSNVSAIYQFHSGFLLPQLKERLSSWEKNPKLGDIMRQAAPFLKMYSLYVQNFDEAMKMVKYWSDKSHSFTSIIKQIQSMPECGNLTLQHHMLGPVQRIPRYKMLLEDYLKRLPEDSPDRAEAQNALQLISQAATHSNETMKQSEKFNKLLSIYNNLLDINLDIVDVSRELIMEGKIVKISARNGEKHERYLYLFNDMLLCCTPVRRLQGKTYKVTAKIDLDGMEIDDVNNMTIPNTFCVNGTKKSMEFAASSPEEKEKWLNAIGDAIENFLARKTSFIKIGSQKWQSTAAQEDLPPDSPVHATDQQLDKPVRPMSPSQSPAHRPISFEEIDASDEKRIEITCTPGNQYVVDIEDHDLGKRAPRWIKDNEVTMCMNCSKAFSLIKRRRHHCRACGRVICAECSEHKLELQYDHSKMQKVCNKCYAILTGCKNAEEVDKKGVLEIEADIVSENSVISEYLHFTEAEKKKAWTKMWCVIPKNELCLYVYGAHQDVRAQMTMPLPGFAVVEDPSLDREFSFKLIQARKVLLFAASSKEQKERWEYVFRKASLGEDLSREDVYRMGKAMDQLQEQLLGEVSARQIPNGSRLSSSSGESSNTSSESSRPTIITDRNTPYTNTDGELSRGSSVVFPESVTS